MQKAILFNNGRSQVVRLPKEFRFKGESLMRALLIVMKNFALY